MPPDLSPDLRNRLARAGELLVLLRMGPPRWTQEEFAGQAGMNYRTVRRIEAGQEVRVLNYDRVAAAFGLPAHWYLIADELLGARDARESADLEIDRARNALVASGRLGPRALELVGELVALADDPGGRDAVEAMATGMLTQLARSREQLRATHARSRSTEPGRR